MKQSIVAIDARSIGKDHTGDTTYWTGLVRGLASLNSDLTYLLFSNAPAPVWIPQTANFRWIELHSQSDRWWSLFRFPLTARRLGARVIHTQYNLSPLVTHGGVTTIHDVSFYHEPDWFRPRDRLLLQRFVPPSARRASRVLTVSEFSKREIHAHISGLADEKVVVAPNACPDEIQPIERDLAKSHVRDHLAVNEPYILTVGTRWPRKNFALALSAADRLPPTLQHRLVVTGKPGWGDEGSSSRATPVGFVDSATLSALYSAADVFLAPAKYEGFGITLLEAFRCGCPVLASANGAHEEVAGGAAQIEPSWDPDAWAQRIERMLASGQDSKDKLRDAGIAREREFTWERTAKIVEQEYRALLA